MIASWEVSSSVASRNVNRSRAGKEEEEEEEEAEKKEDKEK